MRFTCLQGLCLSPCWKTQWSMRVWRLWCTDYVWLQRCSHKSQINQLSYFCTMQRHHWGLQTLVSVNKILMMSIWVSYAMPEIAKKKCNARVSPSLHPLESQEIMSCNVIHTSVITVLLWTEPHSETKALQLQCVITVKSPPLCFKSWYVDCSVCPGLLPLCSFRVDASVYWHLPSLSFYCANLVWIGFWN